MVPPIPNKPFFQSVLCLLFCLVSVAAAGAPVQPAIELSITADFESQELGLGLDYRIAASDNESAEQALAAGDWRQSEQQSLSFGFSPEPRWILFSLHNETQESQTLLVEIANPYLDFIDVYTISRDGQIAQRTALGDQYPAHNRPIIHANFLAPVLVPAESQRLILLRVKTISTTRIPIQVWSRQHYIAADYQRTMAQALIFGFLLAISAYHLLLFFSIGDRGYLYYSIAVLGMLCVVLSMNGVATALVWPGITWLGDYFIMLGICSTIASSAFFTIEVLQLSDRPKLSLIMRLLIVLASVLWLATFIAPYPVVLKAGLLSAVIHALVLIVIYFIRLIDGFSPARYVVAAVLIAAIAVIINVLTSSGVLPSSSLGANAVGIGMVATVLLYSLALSNRMNLDRALREEAQLKLTRDLDLKVRARSDELKQANDKLLHASITDGLTGLFNRRYFDEVFDSEYRRAYRQKQAIAVLMMDIDHFKNLNDNYGHPFGDLCLQTVAKTIGQCLNRPPDICARYGGEEFVVILPNTDLEGAVHVAQLIVQQVAETTVSDPSHAVNLTLSIGVTATIPDQTGDHEALMRTADECLYRAKENGRNRVEYE